MATSALADALGHYLEKASMVGLGICRASSCRSMFDPFGGFGRFSIQRDA
jgi:hypothetical protein